MQRRIVCAAIVKDGRVMLGVRHFDAFMLDDANYFFGSTECLEGAEQGFVDNKGQFLNFDEAYDIAVKAGQIVGRDDSAINSTVEGNDNQTKRYELIIRNFYK